LVRRCDLSVHGHHMVSSSNPDLTASHPGPGPEQASTTTVRADYDDAGPRTTPNELVREWVARSTRASSSDCTLAGPQAPMAKIPTSGTKRPIRGTRPPAIIGVLVPPSIRNRRRFAVSGRAIQLLGLAAPSWLKAIGASVPQGLKEPHRSLAEVGLASLSLPHQVIPNHGRWCEQTPG
jgi:hypothetical protein